MKKLLSLLLAGVISVSLVACGNSKPTLEEVEKAIVNGTVTVEDALNKGWITEERVREYEKDSVPITDKLNSNMLGAFTTTTIANTEFTRDDLSPLTFIAFINPKTEKGAEQYAIIKDSYDDILANGGNVLIVNMSEEVPEIFKGANFPIVYFNDSIKEALGSLYEMVDGNDFTGSWNGNGAFLSAWNLAIEKEGLVATVKAISNMVN